MLFLDKWEIMDPVFGFQQERFTGYTQNFRRLTVAGNAKLYGVSFGLVPDSFGKQGLASELNAHMDKHFDGTVFLQEWPQDLGTFENPSIILSADAAAGASSVSANLIDARNLTTTATNNVVTITATTRTTDVDAEGEWGFFGAGTRETPLVWDDDVRNADAFVCFPTMAQYASISDIRTGDQFRLTQGTLNAVWNVRAVSRRSADRRVVIGFDGSAIVFSGSGNVVDTTIANARVTRDVVTTQTGVNEPLLPGRFLTFHGHDKMYRVGETRSDGFDISPRLYEPVVANSVVDTAPVIPCRYAPEQETAQTYVDNLAGKIIVIEEAYPDTL